MAKVEDNLYMDIMKKGKKLKSVLVHLFSYGITSHPMSDANLFFDKNNINIIIDIRENTLNKCKQGFYPDQFSEIQKDNNREYYYFHDLGNPYHSDLKDELLAAGNDLDKIKYINEKARELYLDYIQQDKLEIGKSLRNPFSSLKKIYTLIAHSMQKTKNFCFICYCNVEKPRIDEPGKCHRFWLIYALKALKRLELGLPSYFDSNENIKKWIKRFIKKSQKQNGVEKKNEK